MMINKHDNKKLSQIFPLLIWTGIYDALAVFCAFHFRMEIWQKWKRKNKKSVIREKGGELRNRNGE